MSFRNGSMLYPKRVESFSMVSEESRCISPFDQRMTVERETLHRRAISLSVYPVLFLKSRISSFNSLLFPLCAYYSVSACCMYIKMNYMLHKTY